MMAAVSFDQLLRDVLERNPRPEDKFEIAAILESLGWNDSRAAISFGVVDVFELAAELWEQCKSRIVYAGFATEEKNTLGTTIVMLIRQFLRGVIFAIPMAISVASMLTLKFSLWSYENLSVELATSIAIGTILSFVAVGGFTQAIARRGFFYIIQGYYNMARQITFRFIRMGFGVCLLLSVALFLLNAVFQLFPFHMLLVILLYFFFLNTIWLSVTVMYILRKELLFTGLIIAGIGIVYLLYVILGISNIIVAQLIALSLVSLVSMVLVTYLFRRAERTAEKGIKIQLPKMSVMIYSTMPYFIYGVLYFAFLFADRVVAWSRNTEVMPYLIWFRGEYELGLDFALLVLILPMGICEVVLTKLMLDIEVSQKQYLGEETGRMNRHYIRIYLRRLVQIVFVAVASAVLLYVFLLYLFEKVPALADKSLFLIPTSYFVFIVALIAYILISIALMNAVTLFSLSQPHFVIRSIWISLLVNVVSGFLLSRWLDYEYAVFGLLLGSIVFAAMSSGHVIRVLGKLDYYLYAAS